MLSLPLIVLGQDINKSDIQINKISENTPIKREPVGKFAEFTGSINAY